MTLGEYIGEQVRKAIAEALHEAQPVFEKAAKDSTADLPKALEAGMFGGGFNLDDFFLGIPVIGDILTAPLGPIKHIVGKAGRFTAAVASGWALGEFFSEALRPVWLEATHLINDTIQSEIFDPNTAADLEAKHIINNAYGRSEAAGGNLSGEHYDKLVAAAREHPDTGVLLRLLNLEVIKEDDAREALHHRGYTDEWITRMFALRRYLLSPADLALGNLRGHISDEVMAAYSHQLGVTDADMQVLIDNTGEPPGTMQMLEAYRRQFIGKDRLERGIRQSRVRNEWIDVIEKLRHSPMTTEQAVRAVIEHYMTDEEGAAVAEQNGLQPDHWHILRESWGRPLAHGQMMELVHRGEATLDDVRQAMRESDIKDKYIEQSIKLGRRLVPERTVVSMLHHGTIDHPTAVVMLHELGYNAADSERLISLGTAQRATAHKALSRSDIVALYEDKLLARDVALEHLVKLGYTHDDAVSVLEIADVKARAVSLKTAQRGVEATLKAHHYTEAQAVAQLVKDGMTRDQAQSLVDQWLQQRGQPTRQLSEAQIIRIVGHQLISPEDALRRLVGLGLVHNDAVLLLRSHGVKVQ